MPKETKSRAEELKEQWLEANAEDEEGGGDDERYDKLQDGRNVRRVLPPREEGDPFYETYAVHYPPNNGEDFASFRCTEPGGPFGHNKKLDKKRNYRARKCEGCKVFCNKKTKARAFEFGSKAGLKFWRNEVAPWRARHQYLLAVSRPRAKDVKERKTAFVLRIGLQIAKPLISAYYDEKGGGDFTNPNTGRNVKIEREQLSQRVTDVKYTTNFELDRSPLVEWKRLRKKLPDLKSFLPEELNAEAQRAIIEQAVNGSDDDGESSKKRNKRKRFDDSDDDPDLGDDDDDDDDADDDGAERKLKTKKRRRGADEEVDPDAAEEDDEEPKKKKKKSKSKLREKLARKAGKD